MTNAFTLKTEKYLKDLDSTAFIYEHNKTGAQVLYLKNTDPNKAFVIGFKTIPSDNTGVAHILEHAVLNGSKKYPVKEPFTFLLKSSLATFINASTYPDKTLYPVASTNEKDLFNLSQVYLDAVFNPLITEEIFMQEGWHYELFDKNEPIQYKGVVFNEMKGAYASVDEQVDNAMRKNLYVGSSFEVDAGGDPNQIPNLTYSDFVNFHKQNYTPSNSNSLIYGDVDVEKFLDLLDSYFSNFETSAKATFKPLPSAPAHTEVVEKFSISDSGEQKPIFIQSWLFDRLLTPEEYFTLEILEHLIVRSEASSIKDALLQSNLGESFYDYGYSQYTAYNFFAFGLRGLHKAENAQKVKELVNLELNKLCDGIDETLLLGAINKVEFSYRTDIGFYNNKGLASFTLCTNFWNYDQDPLQVFDFDTHFANLRSKAKNRYFEDFIKLNFLQNERKLSLTMLPDNQLLTQQNKAEEARLEEYKKTLSDQQIEELIETNKELKKLQEEADSEENLKKLPSLKITDLDKKAREYPISLIPAEYEKTFVKNQEEGVIEIQLAFDLSQIPYELIPHLGLYSNALLKMGTFDKSPQQIAGLLDLYFGKINTGVMAVNHIETGQTVKKFVISFKTLKQNSEKAFELIHEILFGVDFVNETKLKEIVLEEKDSLEPEIMYSGHIMVADAARSSFREDSLYRSATTGLISYSFYKDLSKDFENLFIDISESLLFIHAVLLQKVNFSVNIGCDESQMQYCSKKADDIYNKLHTKAYENHKIALLQPKKRAFIIPAKVNYVGFAVDGSKLSFKPNGLIWPINTIARLEFLWNEIRVKGGAYGAFSQIMEDGLVSYASYRDPNIESTIKSYRRVGSYLAELKLTDEQLANFKISSINRFEPHINSDKIVSSTWRNYIQGYTSQVCQSFKNSIFDVTLQQIQSVGKELKKTNDLTQNLVVLGGKDAISTYEFDEVIELF